MDLLNPFHRPLVLTGHERDPYLPLARRDDRELDDPGLIRHESHMTVCKGARSGWLNVPAWAAAAYRARPVARHTSPHLVGYGLALVAAGYRHVPG